MQSERTIDDGGRRRANAGWTLVALVALAMSTVATLSWLLTSLAVLADQLPKVVRDPLGIPAGTGPQAPMTHRAVAWTSSTVQPGRRPSSEVVDGMPLFTSWLGPDAYAWSEAPLFAVLCGLLAVGLAVITVVLATRSRVLGGLGLAVVLGLLLAPYALPVQWTGVLQHTLAGCEALPCRLDGRGVPVPPDELQVWASSFQYHADIEVLPDRRANRAYPFCWRAAGTRVFVDGQWVEPSHEGGTNGYGCTSPRWTSIPSLDPRPLQRTDHPSLLGHTLELDGTLALEVQRGARPGSLQLALADGHAWLDEPTVDVHGPSQADATRAEQAQRPSCAITERRGWGELTTNCEGRVLVRASGRVQLADGASIHARLGRQVQLPVDHPTACMGHERALIECGLADDGAASLCARGGASGPVSVRLAVDLREAGARERLHRVDRSHLGLHSLTLDEGPERTAVSLDGVEPGWTLWWTEEEGGVEIRGLDGDPVDRSCREPMRGELASVEALREQEGIPVPAEASGDLCASRAALFLQVPFDDIPTVLSEQCCADEGRARPRVCRWDPEPLLEQRRLELQSLRQDVLGAYGGSTGRRRRLQHDYILRTDFEPSWLTPIGARNLARIEEVLRQRGVDLDPPGSL